MNSMNLDLIATISTLLALIVALFQDQIRYLLTRARLRVRFEKDTCFNRGMGEGALYGADEEEANSWVDIRLIVEHVGGWESGGAEVLLMSVYKIENYYGELERCERCDGIVPMNLAWHQLEKSNTKTIFPRKMKKFFKIGRYLKIDQDEANWCFKFSQLTELPDEAVGSVGDCLFEPGSYDLEILITGDNVRPATFWYRLKFDGNFTPYKNGGLENNISFSAI